MQECRRNKLEQESFKRRGTLYYGGLGLIVLVTLDLLVFTPLEAIAVQAIKGVHGGMKGQTCIRRPKLALKSLLLYKQKINCHIYQLQS